MNQQGANRVFNTTVDVLVVDDDADVRELIVEILIREYFKVTTVGSGVDASHILHLYRPRVLITDIFMSDLDGLELIREARKVSPTTKIIAISGGGSRHGNFLCAAKLLGADAILGKPFGRSDLLHIVASLLDDSS